MILETEPSTCACSNIAGLMKRIDAEMDRHASNQALLSAIRKSKRDRYEAIQRFKSMQFGDSPEERQKAAVARYEATGRLFA